MENPTGPLSLIDVFYIDVIGDRDADADAQADNDSGTGSGSNPAVNDEAIGDSADDRKHLL